MAADMGFLLADSVKESFGLCQQADLHFLADLAPGTAAYNVDLLAAYTAPPTLVAQPIGSDSLPEFDVGQSQGEAVKLRF